MFANNVLKIGYLINTNYYANNNFVIGEIHFTEDLFP